MSTYFERRPCKTNVNKTIHSLIYLFSKHLWHAGHLPGTMFYAIKMVVDKNQFPALIECPLSRRARPLANEYTHVYTSDSAKCSEVKESRRKNRDGWIVVGVGCFKMG